MNIRNGVSPKFTLSTGMLTYTVDWDRTKFDHHSSCPSPAGLYASFLLASDLLAFYYRYSDHIPALTLIV